MKNIYLAAALAAFAFSACTVIDDDDDETSNPKSGACYTDIGDGLEMCFQGITEHLTRADCDEMSYETGNVVRYQNSCQSGQKLKCNIDGEGYIYVYGQTVTDYGLTCDDVLNGNFGKEGICYLSDIHYYGIVYGDLAMCLEGKSVTPFSCNYAAAMYNGTASFPSNCPSDYKLKCLGESDGQEAYVYVYGQIVTAQGMTCEDAGYRDASQGSGSRPSSSSIYPSSSSNLATGVCYDDYGYCYESRYGTISRSECTSYYGGITMASCPSGYKLICYDDYYEEYNYFYNTNANITCEYYDLSPVTSTPSSSSSSSSNSGKGACYDEEYSLCWEYATYTITSSDCYDGEIFMSSCPGGQLMKCSDYFEIYYLYGSEWEGATCSDFGLEKKFKSSKVLKTREAP